MSVLWDDGHGSVQDVLDGLRVRPRPAYNTVLTILRILERKGYVRHEQVGRAYVYRPVVARVAARREAVKNVVARFFDGSADALVLHLVEHDALSPDELARLRRLIEAAEQEPG